ncbi:hypothetical protein KVT40_006422 [Elsinoe batatas]|uniref:Uncharacterized protein n=1 Tax=Elsinoe batatas TaxID=2601811 RepID=A0A8K0KXM4_9PEZI|nr:hypothetical protein KVT40_006422 [Elsinoe batatas]
MHSCPRNNCGAHEVLLSFCHECKDLLAPDLTTTRRFAWCTERCRLSDQANHAAECQAAKDRSALVDIVKWLKELLLQIRERTYQHPIAEVTRESWGLRATLTPVVPAGETLAGPPRDGGVATFPLIRGGRRERRWRLEQEEEQALLTMDWDEKAILLSQKMFLPVFQGITDGGAAAFDIVTATPNTTTRATKIGLRVSNGHSPRTFLRITLRSREVYAINLTGDQIGWEEAIMPYTTLERQCIARINLRPLAPPSANVMVKRLGSLTIPSLGFSDQEICDDIFWLEYTLQFAEAMERRLATIYQQHPISVNGWTGAQVRNLLSRLLAAFRQAVPEVAQAMNFANIRTQAASRYDMVLQRARQQRSLVVPTQQ